MAEIKTIFSGDASGLQATIGQASRSLGRFGQTVTSLRAGIAGALGGGIVLGFARSVVDMFGQIQDAADSLDISPRALMSLQLIGDEAGVSAEKIEMAVGRITGARWDAMADPTGNAAKQFRQLGISMEELRRMSPEETLQAVARAMAAGAGNGAVMAAAMDMVGSRSKRMLAVLKEVGSQDNWPVNEELNKIARNMDAAGDQWKFIGKAFLTGAGAAASDIMELIRTAPERFDAEDAALLKTASEARAKRAALEGQEGLRAQIEAALPQVGRGKIDEGLRAANVNATLRAASLSDSLRRIGGGTVGTDSHLQEKQYDAILEIARNTRAAAMKDTTPKFAR